MSQMLDWGGTAKRGWTPVARIFLRNYTAMGISSDEAMLVIQILDFAWGKNHMPFPKVETLASFMGLHAKTVRTYIKNLRDKGFLQTRLRNGRSNEYDFSPLFARLRQLSGEAATYEHEMVLLDEGSMSTVVDCSTPGKAKVIMHEAATGEVVDQYEVIIQGNKAPPAYPKTLQAPEPAVELTGREPTGHASMEPTRNSSMEPTAEATNRIRRLQEDEQPNSCATHEKLQSIVDKALAGRKAAQQLKALVTKSEPKEVRLTAKGKPKPKAETLLYKQPETYNCNDLIGLFIREWKRKWPQVTAPLMGMKERALLKQLIDHYGAAETAKVVLEMFARWDTLAPKIKVKGSYPSISILWGFRGTLFPMILEGELTAKPAWGAHFESEKQTQKTDEVFTL